MQKAIRGLMIGFGLVALVGAATLFMGPTHYANACGYGQAGGSDYVPQRKDQAGQQLAQRSAINIDQARQIVSRHISTLNPNLKVGSLNDAGAFYEAEILSKDGEVVQMMGIDKFSGRLMLLN